MEIGKQTYRLEVSIYCSWFKAQAMAERTSSVFKGTSDEEQVS